MGIENSYRDSKEILKVSDISKKYHKTYKTIIVTFQSRVLEGLISSQLVKAIPNVKFGSAHGSNNIYEVLSNKDVLFFLSPVGAPITVGILEEITYTMGVENIVMYGTCGVLDSDVTSGKIIVPTKAYRDEGTSYHYLPASDFVDIENSEVVSIFLDDLNISYIKGYTWTTDAFYRETQALYKERKSQGCISVEMEVSAVQAFSQLRNLNFYTFIYGADSLDSTKWDKRILGNHSVEERVKYFLIACELASKIQKRLK